MRQVKRTRHYLWPERIGFKWLFMEKIFAVHSSHDFDALLQFWTRSLPLVINNDRSLRWEQILKTDFNFNVFQEMQVWFWLHLTEVTWNRPIYNTETLAAGNQTQVYVFMRTIVIHWASRKMNMSNLLSSLFPFLVITDSKGAWVWGNWEKRNTPWILESFHI